MFGFSILDADTQHSVDLNAEAFAPLGFEALAALREHLAEPLQFPLQLSNGPAAASAQALTLAMDGPNANGLVGLVAGGWLPAGLWRPDAVLMPDQNAAAAMRKHLHGRVGKADADKDFIDRLAEQTATVNPLLLMIEGQRGRLPRNVAELAQNYQREQQRLLEVLPRAQIFPSQAEAIKAAIGLLDQRRPSLEREKRFLLAAAPLLVPEAGKSRRAALWAQLLELARQHQIAPASQLFIAVLSATAALPELNPARDLLKPVRHYTEKEAYDALAKLRAVDVLNAAIAVFGDKQTVLLTQDRALALWWTGVKPHSHSRDGKILNYRLNLERQLFQRLDGEEWEQLTQLIFQSPAPRVAAK